MIKLSKIYNFKEMNSYQYIAVVGIIMSLGANLLLVMGNKAVEDFWALYLCWSVLFVIGSILNLNQKPGNDHHHHH